MGHGREGCLPAKTAVRDLVILGTGAHPPELAQIVERVNQAGPSWNLLGYVWNSPEHTGELINGYPVLGGPEKVAELRDAFFVHSYGAYGIPAPRERLVTLVDPTCFVSHTAQIGVSCVFYPNCYVGHNARVGDFVFCMTGSIINHDDVLEDRVALTSGVLLAGNVRVEAGCYLGQGCTVRQDIRIGRGSLVGAGAVVVKDVEPNSVVAGNPARLLRKRIEEEGHDN